MVVTELHGGVDVLRARYALLKHSHRFQTEHHAEPTRSKTRNVFHDDRLFPQLATDCRYCFNSLSAGLFTNHDFNQSHDMDRIEKVHTDNRFGALGRTGYLGDRKSTRLNS